MKVIPAIKKQHRINLPLAGALAFAAPIACFCKEMPGDIIDPSGDY
jgi:hypothetical protein